MQRKRYITFFFIFISMVMLVVPVIPHHHHNNGLICMKNDITPNCCGQQHTPDSEHCNSYGLKPPNMAARRI